MSATETQRRLGNRERLLAYLKAHPLATNLELMQPHAGGPRFGGRIEELRKLGHDIVTDAKPRHGGIVWYAYRGYREPRQVALAFTEAA